MKIWIDDEEEKDIDSSQELLEEEPEEDNSDRCIVHAIFFELAFGAVLYLKSARKFYSSKFDSFLKHSINTVFFY